MQEYSLTLPNQKTGTYKLVTLFIFLMHLFVFGYMFFSLQTSSLKNIVLFGMILSALSLILFILNAYTEFLFSHRPEISIFAISIIWIILGAYLMGGCILLLGLLGLYTRKKFDIIFRQDGILYPSFPPKLINWKEVSHVILKDNVLTLDLKNNKMLQSVISKESGAEINESDFNDFCHTQLQAVS